MTGLDAAFTQNLGEHGNASIHTAMRRLNRLAWELVSNSPDELRSMIHAGRRQAVTARLAMTVPHAGTA